MNPSGMQQGFSTPVMPQQGQTVFLQQDAHWMLPMAAVQHHQAMPQCATVVQLPPGYVLVQPTMGAVAHTSHSAAEAQHGVPAQATSPFTTVATPDGSSGWLPAPGTGIFM
jgi:hypothetical protein